MHTDNLVRPLVLEAIRPIGMEEVLEERIAWERTDFIQLGKNFKFNRSISDAASTTKSAAFIFAKSVLGLILAEIAFASSLDIFSFSTLRCRFLSITAIPRSTNSVEIS